MKQVRPDYRLRHKALALGLAVALGGAGGPLAAAPAHAPSIAGPTELQLRLAPGLERLRQAAPRPHSGGALRAVANCNDAGPGSLRDAIATAAEGDTIDLTALTCSIISLSTGQIEIPQQDLAIQGPGRDRLLIDAQGGSRAFNASGKYVQYSEISLSGMTIANGRDVNAGCIQAHGNLTLHDVAIRDCLAQGTGSDAAMGGGASVLGNLYLIDSVVTGNQVVTGAGDSAGGGVFSFKYVTAQNSEISGNSAIAGSGPALGGGVFGKGVGIMASRVLDNVAQADGGEALGGGILSNGSTDPVEAARTMTLIVQSHVSGNQARSTNGAAHGGGAQTGRHLSPSGGASTILNSTVSDNSAASECASCVITGGGVSGVGSIYAKYSTISDNAVTLGPASHGQAGGGGLIVYPYNTPAPAVLQAIQATVSGNHADAPAGAGLGGGLAVDLQPVLLSGTTIAFNSASTRGGGVLLSGGGSTFVSALLSDNQAPTGADLDAAGATSVAGHHNLVRNAAPTISLPADTKNRNPGLLPLANNGGPTRTHALGDCSPLGGGDADGADYDQRGAPYVREYYGQADIGAWESQPDPDRIFQGDFDYHAC